MRLVFDNEIRFLKRELGIEIPSKTAFINKMCVKMMDIEGKWHTIYRLKCKSEKLTLTSDNRDKMNEIEFRNWNDLIDLNMDRLAHLEEESKNIIIDSQKENIDKRIIVPVSGGKDSAVVHYLVNNIANIREETLFSNTSNETHITYKYIKKHYGDAIIVSPKEGFYNFVNRTGFIPTRFGRACCTNQKEMPMIEQLNKDESILFFMGMRKAESTNRSQYENKWKNTRWGKRDWIATLPILEWQDLDVLLYMLWRGIPFNELYTMGYGRVGCTNCCFRSDYELLLNKEFLTPYYDRWQIILEKDFVKNKKAPILNCTLDEYKKFAWKAGAIRDNATEDIINEFATQQGIERKIAVKYFDKNCLCCEKKLKKDDIAMSLKSYGRNIENFKCLKCIAKDMGVDLKTIKEKMNDFKDGGCTLF